MREQWNDQQRAEIAGRRLARVLTVPAAPDGAAGGSAGELPAITLRQPDGAWRPYRPAAAGEQASVGGSEPEPSAPGGSESPAAGAGARLTRLAGHAFDPGRPGLRALAVVAVVVAFGAGLLAWWSRPSPSRSFRSCSGSPPHRPRPRRWC